MLFKGWQFVTPFVTWTLVKEYDFWLFKHSGKKQISLSVFITEITKQLLCGWLIMHFWWNHEYTVRKLVLHFKTKHWDWVLSCSPGLEFWNPFSIMSCWIPFVRKHFRQLNIDENRSHGSSWRRTSVLWKCWVIALVFQKHGGKKSWVKTAGY